MSDKSALRSRWTPFRFTRDSPPGIIGILQSPGNRTLRARQKESRFNSKRLHISVVLGIGLRAAELFADCYRSSELQDIPPRKDQKAGLERQCPVMEIDCVQLKSTQEEDEQQA